MTCLCVYRGWVHQGCLLILANVLLKAAMTFNTAVGG